MSTTNMIVGGAVVGGLLQLTLSLVLPEEKPIVVHSLRYEGGKVFQDRTITTEDEFFPAQWKAVIVSVETQRPVDGCSGQGFWPYPEGRKTAPIPLTEWVGSETCTPEYLQSLGGEFYPVAYWYWGNDKTDHTGETFRP